jgi:Protein of unknown function (DUF1579)
MTRTLGVLTMVLLPQLGNAQEKAPAKAEPAKAEPAKPAAGKPEAPKMEAPKPGPELDALKPVAGMWNCDGKTSDGPMGPGHAYKATVNQKWDLGNFWIWQEYKVMKSKENPMAFNAKGWMGWDAANKHYVWAGVDDMGGWISLTSTGWTGDNFEFAGDAMGPMGKMKAKFTLTKGKTPNEMSMATTMTAADGKAMSWSETCKKK